LHQHKLNVPSSGGLGSFKLSVLLAAHIEQHLSYGGLDKPGEVLLTFLFRYGCGDVNTHSHATIPNQVSVLRKDTVVTTTKIPYRPTTFHYQPASANLSNVRLLQDIVALFQLTWTALTQRIHSSNSQNSSQPYISFLDNIIDSHHLQQYRQICLKQVNDMLENNLSFSSTTT
jgi:hypothetical protein